MAAACCGGPVSSCILLNFVTERVGIVVHPGHQRSCGFVRIDPHSLPRSDPQADEILDEHPEIATRVVELFGFRVASRKEGLTKSYRTRRLLWDQLLDVRRNRFQAADKREA